VDKNTTYSFADLPVVDLQTSILRDEDKRNPNDPVTYIVDETGEGTHKTLDAAMKDAEKHPHRLTMVTIRPHTTIENFELPDAPRGDV